MDKTYILAALANAASGVAARIAVVLVHFFFKKKQEKKKLGF